jgi:heme/copper-type cytochrome/quinol oxidase subunit 2
MSNQKNSILVAVIIALIGFFVFSQSKTKMMPAMNQPQGQVTPSVTPETKEVPLSTGTIEIEAGSFYYKPSVLKLKKGEKVTLKLNSVSMMHDFNIDELSLKIPVTKSGDVASVEFTPTEVGEFEYYCSIGQHRANGQVGKLIVVE